MPTPPTTDVNKRVEQYITLRDKIKALDEEHKNKMKPFRDMLENLGGIMLQHLKAIGADSVAGKAGTVYKTVKHSASIADGDAFWGYIVENDAWDLLDRKANVTAVSDYIEQHQAAPPGVNFTSVITVGVRRK